MTDAANFSGQTNGRLSYPAEATMWAAVQNAQRGVSNMVLLTSLGGGAFGNHESWIHAAIQRALHLVSNIALDVRLVSYRTAAESLVKLAKSFE